MGQSINTRYRLDAEAIILALRRKGIQIWIEDGTLRYRARKGALTADDAVRLRQLASSYSRGYYPDDVYRFEPYVPPQAHSTRLPLAFSQLDHWNLRASAGYRPVRQVSSATRLQGKLDEGALKEAFSQIVNRHESLRTRIVVVNGEVGQETSDCEGHQLSVLDLTSHAPRKQPLEIQRQIASAITDVANYAKDPLFQAVLLKLAKDEHVLILTLDHMVSDGVSISIVLQELLTAHTQGVSGGKISLPPVRMQFPAYALWQREALSGWLSRQAPIWNGWCRTQFPGEAEATAQAGWGRVKFLIDARMKTALEQLARNRGTSLVMTVLTAYVALMSHWCDSLVVFLQVMSDGRRSSLVENTIGYLAFPLYLRAQVSRRDTFVDLLEIVTKEYCRASEQPDFYYSYAQSPQPDFVHNTVFNWLPKRDRGDEYYSERAGPLTLSEVLFENPCLESLEWDNEPCVLFRDAGEDVLGEVTYPRRRFSPRTMQRFVTNFRRVLDALVNRSEIGLCDIVMI